MGLPGVMTLPDGGGILVAKRQEVEKLSQVEQGLNVILKRMMGYTWGTDVRQTL